MQKLIAVSLLTFALTSSLAARAEDGITKVCGRVGLEQVVLLNGNGAQGPSIASGIDIRVPTERSGSIIAFSSDRQLAEALKGHRYDTQICVNGRLARGPNGTTLIRVSTID